MNVKEAYTAGLLTVGRRVKTDGTLGTAINKAFTGRITKITVINIIINRDDEDSNSCWSVRLTNTVAQIEMLDHVPFKKGDFVKLRAGSTATSIAIKLLPADNIVKGRTYIVDEGTSDHIRIRGTPVGYLHDADNFVLVSSPSKTKSDSKGENIMSENTRSVAVNDTIMKVLEEKANKTVMLVNKYFGEEIPNNFTGKLLLEEKTDKFIKEAEDREKEALKEVAAEK